jgi:hypothetical protein
MHNDVDETHEIPNPLTTGKKLQTPGFDTTFDNDKPCSHPLELPTDLTHRLSQHPAQLA